MALIARPVSAGYVGRFAPSPTGPLHAGSMVAALASWLDARAAGGRWLVRIEDIDPPRCRPGADTEILRQLNHCGLEPDAPPVWQSRRHGLYLAQLEELADRGLAYPCRCTRKRINEVLAATGRISQRHGELVYPGTCRPAIGSETGWSKASLSEPLQAWRLLTRREPDPDDILVDWQDRRLGLRHQNVSREVGDFVLRRADGLWAYQLAVVVDDAEQGVTDVVRGEDLLDNTPRQIWLQQCLGLPRPRYLHVPLVLDERGEKLSKQHGAAPVRVETRQQVLGVLTQAGRALGLQGVSDSEATIAQWLESAVAAWAALADGMMPARLRQPRASDQD
jgi:glutamyl-Q tRNA(Asp) synthetase